MTRISRLLAAALLAAGACVGAQAQTIGSSFPAGFPVIEDTSLGKPVIGFGAAGSVARTPVIFLHGNNDTPFPTACNPLGRVQAFAQYLADRGYAPSELWALGYQGDQCNLGADQTNRSRIAHTVAANVPDLSRFVAIDGPNHGIINCSPNPANYFQSPAAGGFTPDAEICKELGSPDTPFLKRLNRGDDTPSPTRVLVIRNADKSFVYFPIQDGVIAPVPAEDSFGRATDFSRSASLQGAFELNLTGQGAFDPVLGTSHLGILNSPQTWAATFDFLAGRPRR